MEQLNREGADGEAASTDTRKNQNYPLIKYSDMMEEIRIEAMEMVVTAVEKFPTNNESSARMIKETMDKKYGSSWHVVVGEGFGFEITNEVKSLQFMYFGSIAVLLWKCS
eukprot:Opistho-2@35854